MRAPAIPRARRIAYALALTLAVFGGAELLARQLAAPPPAAVQGLRVGHHPDAPYLQHDAAAGGWVRAREELLPQTFVPETVPPGTLRVAVLGGSTVATLPPDGPAFQLAGLLSAGLAPPPALTVGGGAGFGSTRVAGLLDELLGHGLDLVVLYTGHNEFAEARHASRHLDLRPGPGPALARWLDRSHLVAGLRGLLRPGGPALAPFEAPGGPLVPGEAAVLTARFAQNLAHMATAARAAGARSLWVLPASNPAHPPIASSPLPGALSAPAAAAESAWATVQQGAPPAAVSAAAAATSAFVAAAPDHARAWWLHGQLCLAQGELSAAAAALQRARDLDQAPVRATTALRETMAQVAHQHGISVVDAEAVLRRQGDRAWLLGRRAVDPMHLDATGYRLVAAAVYDQLRADGLPLAPAPAAPRGPTGAVQAPAALLQARGPTLPAPRVRHPGAAPLSPGPAPPPAHRPGPGW